jgi:hypothetical protein
MFQVIADRAEKAALIVITNLPFFEWPQVNRNPRLCKTLIDRLSTAVQASNARWPASGRRSRPSAAPSISTATCLRMRRTLCTRKSRRTTTT